MFYVVISEKGGSQKRLEFDKKEITIGRVQGNDIILPKGNVSKRHSRIVLKDGKFIIVDLKSTNGTFVNGRKISSPQMIKSSDRVYVGDFTMSVEEYEGEAGDLGDGAPKDIEEGDVPQAPTPIGNKPPTPVAPLPVQPQPPRQPSVAATPIVPRAPIASPAPEPKRPNPTPPPMIKPVVLAPNGVSPLSSGKLSNGALMANKAPNLSASNQPAQKPRPIETPVLPAKPAAAPAKIVVATLPKRRAYSEPQPPATDPRESLLRAKGFLLEKLGQQMDTTSIARITPALLDSTKKKIAELLKTHKASLGTIPNTNQCIDEICNEAIGLGPLGALLQDKAVTEIFVNGPYQVMTTGASGTKTQSSVFGSELGLLCAIDRMLKASGRCLPLEPTSLDVRLRDGTHLLASFPPISARGTTLVIRKGAPTQTTLPDLIASGTLSENAAAFLEVCVRARLSVLISGGPDSGRGALLQAFSALFSPEERVGMLSDESSLSLNHPQVFVLRQTAVLQALRLGATRLVVNDLLPTCSFELVRAMSSRTDGALVSTIAQNSQEAFDRVSSYAHLGEPGALLEVVREMAGRAFSLIVHTMRFSDGSKRVVQISEVCQVLDQDSNPMVAPSDLFIWDGEGLVPTRQVPQFWPMLEARGEVNSNALFE